MTLLCLPKIIEPCILVEARKKLAAKYDITIPEEDFARTCCRLVCGVFCCYCEGDLRTAIAQALLQIKHEEAAALSGSAKW